MRAQPPHSPDEIQDLPWVAPFTERERAALGLRSIADDATGYVAASPQGTSDDGHPARPFGVAAQVFLAANATTTALVSAQQAYVLA